VKNVWAVSFFLAGWLAGSVAAQEAGPVEYPPLVPEAVRPEWGAHIQRTMRLLAESRPEDRKRVRILVYGQSITGGRYSSLIEKWLREKYPDADIELENRAIGGYASHQLIRPAESDLYPFYPDLLIFHVYGVNENYEAILRAVRSRTAAEVMLISNHWKRDTVVDGKLPPNTPDRDEARLQQLARQYGCELVEVRDPWHAYLEQHNLLPGDLLRDNVHLNEHGKWLAAQLIQRQMIYRPELAQTASDGLVREVPVVPATDFKEGRLVLEFEGNRVDVVSRTRVGTAGGSALRVTIDGQKPSEFRELYAFTRPTSLVMPHEWPAVARVGAESLPQVELWRCEILAVNPDRPEVRYRVVGSVTGEDGEGISTADFVSRSGRVRIEKKDWDIWSNRQEQYQPGMAFYWQVVPLHCDLFFPPIRLDDLRESTATLFQGLPNGKHTLELTVEGGAVPPPISMLRIYRPALLESSGSKELAGESEVGGGKLPVDMALKERP
jgi:hypothetical protein